MLNDKKILITGGTGSFGRKFAEIILKRYKPKKVIIFSRDELKQFEMSREFSSNDYPISYFIGDVRDKDRLYRAFDGVDFVIHAAALKQVPASERNPFEAVKTNVLGAANIIDAAIDNGVKKVIGISTDKAVNPVNLYGATKLCSDKLFTAGNSYSGENGTKFSVVRYGNVVGSRGSVIPSFLKMRENGIITITDPRMTRFWIQLEQCMKFVLQCLEIMNGGEVFVPKIASMNMMDLAKAIAPNCEHKIIGIRPGEKIHEVLITESDSRHTLEYSDFFIVEPEFNWWSNEKHINNGGTPVAEDFVYASNLNDKWLQIEELRKIVVELECEFKRA